jgi:hypothetical protein
MKKLILSMAVIATLASCSKAKEAINCADAKAKLATAASAYTSAQNKETCTAYKAAITTYIGTSCPTVEEKAILEEYSTVLTCE